MAPGRNVLYIKVNRTYSKSPRAEQKHCQSKDCLAETWAPICWWAHLDVTVKETSQIKEQAHPPCLFDPEPLWRLRCSDSLSCTFRNLVQNKILPHKHQDPRVAQLERGSVLVYNISPKDFVPGVESRLYQWMEKNFMVCWIRNIHSQFHYFQIFKRRLISMTMWH